MPVIKGFIAEGIVACFTEPNATGHIFDFDAPRNAPAKNPAAHMDKVLWHSEFFQYELAMPIQTVTVSHATVAGRQKFWGEQSRYNGNSVIASSFLKYVVNGRVVTASHNLVAHNLGFRPLAFIAYNDRMLMPGVAVQTASNGRNRFVAPFVTTTHVGIREVANASDEPLPAISRSYQVMVFNTPEADPALALFSGGSGWAQLGRGKVQTGNHYLRRREPTEASQFNIDHGPTVDINSGRARIVTGGNVTTEAGYAGSFSGPSYVPVNV